MKTEIYPTVTTHDKINLGGIIVIHPYTVIGKLPDKSLALARSAKVEERPVVGVGENCVIGCHCVIYADVEVGDNCIIGDHVVIREGTRIGNNCVIGQGVSVHYDVRIGNRTRIVNGSHVTGGCQIGDDCFLGVGVITSNDRHIDLNNYHFDESRLAPPIIGNRVLIGSGANILAGVSIGDDCTIGAGALIVKDVPKDSKVLGVAAAIMPKRADHG